MLGDSPTGGRRLRNMSILLGAISTCDRLCRANAIIYVIRLSKGITDSLKALCQKKRLFDTVL